MKYLLPKELGGAEVEAEEFWGGCAGAQPEYHLPGGFTLLAPKGEPLTPVAPPQPEEPSPGAYDINGQLCQHFADRADEQRWCIIGHLPILTWPQLWEQIGGPDVTIQPLVALPTVELPFKRRGVEVSRTRPDGDDVYLSTKGASYGFAHLSDNDATAVAYAILSAVAQRGAS